MDRPTTIHPFPARPYIAQRPVEEFEKELVGPMPEKLVRDGWDRWDYLIVGAGAVLGVLAWIAFINQIVTSLQ